MSKVTEIICRDEETGKEVYHETVKGVILCCQGDADYILDFMQFDGTKYLCIEIAPHTQRLVNRGKG